MKIITGAAETDHVTANDLRNTFVGIFGVDSYILNTGEQFAYTLVSNNQIDIATGTMCHHGNLSSEEKGESIAITNGTQGMKRIDLIVNRYQKDEETGLEKNDWVYLMGEPDASNPVAPEYVKGNPLNGDSIDDCPYLKITLDGLNIESVESLLPVAPQIDEQPDCTIETGQNGSRHWVKFSNGEMIQWGKIALNEVEFTGTDGYLKYGSSRVVYFAENFVSDPVVTITMQHPSVAFFPAIEKTEKHGFWFWPYGTKAGSATNVEVNWQATGRWK